MTLAITCANCGASYQLSDSLEGKKVRCKSCDEAILVRRAAGSGKKSAGKAADEDDPDEAVETGTRRTTASKPRSVRRGRSEDEEAPRASRPRRRDEEEDDRSPGDRKRSRKGRQPEKSILPWVIVGAGGGVLLLVVLGVGIWLLSRGAKKEQALANNNQPPIVDQRGPAGQPDAGQRPNPDQGRPKPAPAAPGLVKAATLKVPVEYQRGLVERVLLGGPGSQRAAVCTQALGGTTHVFESFDVPGGKRLCRVELTNVAVPQQMTLSPDGTRLAVAELVTLQGRLQSAISIWSLPDGKVLQSRWAPPLGNDVFANLRRMTFLDSNRLLTVTLGRQLALWNVSGEPVYTKDLKIPGLFDSLTEDPYTKQPQNFALSADRGSIALFNGVGFDVLDTGTGQLRVKTAPFIGQGQSIHGVALDRDASRLAVYLWVPGPKGIDDRLVLWDLKANQQKGPFQIRVQKQNTAGRFTWGGNALSWWGPDHLLLWGGNGNALVLEAATGAPLRELEGPQNGRYGFDDPDGRVWYAGNVPTQAKAFLCAVDLPREELQKDQGLDGKYYKRWWLVESGIAAQAEAGDVRPRAFPRVGPAQ